MEPRQVTAAQVRSVAGDEFDHNPAVMGLGLSRESWIHSRLMSLGFEPDAKADATVYSFGPQMSGRATLTEPQQTAVFRAEFDAAAETYAAMGVSRDQYVKSRRIDVGLEQLSMTGTPAAAAPAQALANDPANARFAAEFDATPSVYAEMGLSKEQYIKSRRIDEGLDTLSMAGAAK